jgi:serine/threonine protein phosphatase PrpC
LCAALLLCLHDRYGRDNTERQGSDGFGDRYSVSCFTSTNVQILTLAVLATDGVWDVLRNEEAIEVVMAARDSGRDASTAGTQSTQITSFTRAKAEAIEVVMAARESGQGREHGRCSVYLLY